jgi:hypothetical protein
MESTRIRRALRGAKGPGTALYRDEQGTALLEVVIVLPVLLVFMMAVMELCLLANARQLANYAAFCAARTTAVYGLSSEAGEKAHLAAALAMSGVCRKTVQDPTAVLSAYGVDDPAQTVQAVCRIPGFNGNTAEWGARLADAYVRTGMPARDTATAPGKTRRHVTVDVTYIHHCAFFPIGSFWGHGEVNAYVAALQALPYYYVIAPYVTGIANSWRWNVPIHGRAVLDYWAEEG